MTRTLQPPMSMCPPMVRAFLDGRKTVTRRAIVPQPPPGTVKLGRSVFGGLFSAFDKDGELIEVPRKDGKGMCIWEARPRYRWHHTYWLRTKRFQFKADTTAWVHVLDVRAERVQEITLDGILAEGCPDNILCKTIGSWDIAAAVDWWIALWNRLNGKRGPKPGDYSWDANPWVFRYQIELAEKPPDWDEVLAAEAEQKARKAKKG